MPGVKEFAILAFGFVRGHFMIRIASGFFIVCALVSAATAKDATIGGVSVTLPPPPGYCALDPQHASDARAIKILETALSNSGGRLLDMSADCEQLVDWRAGKRRLLDNVAQYQTPTEFEAKPAPSNPDDAAKGICAFMRTQGDKIAANVQSTMKIPDDLVKNLKINETRSVGVVGEEPGVCYAALVQKMTLERNTEKTQLALSATLFIRGKVVIYYLYAPYRGGDTVTELLAQQRANVARLKAANKN